MISALLFAALGDASPPPASWTILFYGAANNSCEETVLGDIAEMKRGFVDGQGVELVLLLDRAGGFSEDAETLGEDFQDTRLYRITHDEAERLDGAPQMPEITRTSTFDANVGDAHTLQQFVRFGKAHYPAQHYALVFYSHGDGQSFGADSDSKGDALCSAELTSVLEAQDSVDVMAFDVCSMGGVENLYQWRPDTGRFGAHVVVASPSVSGPLPYDTLLARLRRDGKDALDPARTTPQELGTAIVRAKHDELRALHPSRAEEGNFEAWGCYDLSNVTALKAAVDGLASELASPEAKTIVCGLRGFPGVPGAAMNYMPPDENVWSSMPYFDLGELAQRIADHGKLSDAARERARAVIASLKNVIVSSFGMSLYPGFQDRKNGLYIVFPDGDTKTGILRNTWSDFLWYAPRAPDEKPRTCPGLAWCGDGAKEGNERVENWFELLDRWFDGAEGGGKNRYRP